jgi:metallo-beta-lactamase class B
MKLLKRQLRTTLFILLALISSFAATAQKKEWSQPYEPFRIAGNLYYVGTYDLACYLVATPKGHILINAALDSTVPMIQAHVEQLGFKFSDIKILLSSQAHFDHVGGMARIQKLTGAQVMIDEQDAQVMADGGNSDFLYGGKGVGSLFQPVHVDRKLHDGDVITLGNTTLNFLHHPGHTKGSSSYLLDVKDDKRTYRVLIANMPTVLDETDLKGMPTYPAVGKDYAYTLNSLKKLKFDLWVCAHASQFNLHENRKPGDSYKPQLFMDRKAYDKELADLREDYDLKLKK